MKRECAKVGFVLLALWAGASRCSAADWPQWRGPERNGISRETGWLACWPEKQPPKTAWRTKVGKDHSAVSVAAGRADTMGWDGRQDTVFCFDAATGQLERKKSYPCEGIKQWPGPATMPTVDGGSVYTLSRWGQLHAWDAQTGRPKWSVKLHRGYNPDGDYGCAWSPLAEGDLLILSAGRKGLAFFKETGKAAWGDDHQHGACTSAVTYEHQGRRGVVVMHTPPQHNCAHLVGIDPKTGEELWRYTGWREFYGAMCIDQLVQDGKVFITGAGQDTLCEWRELCKRLRDRCEKGDQLAKAHLREIGGITTDCAYKYRVQQALSQGLPVPTRLLADYPDLTGLH